MNPEQSDFKPVRDAGAVSVSIIVPMYCDWDSVSELLRRFGAAGEWIIGGHQVAVSIIVVDDSPQFSNPLPTGFPDSLAGRVRVLKLKRNVGHQRAIAIGLAHALANGNADYLVIMDGDGEDSPADVPRMLAAAFEAGGHSIIFAERTKRHEALWFRAGYAGYRLLHWVLTGHRIRFGNFSAIPRELASMVLASPDLWSHYAAAVVRLRLPYQLLPTERTARYAGESRMSPVTLMAHGLTAVSVFYEVATVRLTMMLGFLAAGAAILFSAGEAVTTAGAAQLVCRIGGFWLSALALVVLCLHQSLAILRGKTHSEVMPSMDGPLLIEPP